MHSHERLLVHNVMFGTMSHMYLFLVEEHITVKTKLRENFSFRILWCWTFGRLFFVVRPFQFSAVSASE